MRVTAIGGETELGRIGKSLQDIAIESSPLRDEIGLLTRRLAVIGIGLCLVLALLLLGVARRLARRLAGGHHAGDGHPAAGVPGHHDRLSCARRAAHRQRSAC